MFTIIELFSEEEEREINHHGSMRKVDDQKDNDELTKVENAYKIAKKFGNFIILQDSILPIFILISETTIVPLFAVMFSLAYCVLSVLCYFNYY